MTWFQLKDATHNRDSAQLHHTRSIFKKPQFFPSTTTWSWGLIITAGLYQLNYSYLPCVWLNCIQGQRVALIGSKNETLLLPGTWTLSPSSLQREARRKNVTLSQRDAFQITIWPCIIKAWTLPSFLTLHVAPTWTSTKKQWQIRTLNNKDLTFSYFAFL